MSPGPGGYRLRQASHADRRAIRRLVRQARINPTGLAWPRFIVAVDGSGQVIGCGQIKPHRGGSRELASIVVDPAWRGRGVGGSIIGRLMQAGPPLWLVCRFPLTQLYARFGFRSVSASDPAPDHFRRLLRLGRWLNRLSPPDSQLCVMAWLG